MVQRVYVRDTLMTRHESDLRSYPPRRVVRFSRKAFSTFRIRNVIPDSPTRNADPVTRPTTPTMR